MEALRVLLLILVTCACCAAQTATATIVGLVTDATGSSVPSANISVKNLRTGYERSFRTSSSGEYIFPALLAGEYSMQVTADGFQTKSIKLIPLTVNQTARVDVKLSPGSVAQTVDVDAVVPLLNTETAALGQVINTQRILDPP